MLIMSTQLSRTIFPCISVLACSNSWARQHFVSKNKPLATMSNNFPASSLALNQSILNRGAAFTRQGTSNRQLKHIIRSLATDSCNQPTKMDTVLYHYFPINLKEGSKTKARNGQIYRELQNGVKYLDIYEGDGEMGKEGEKFDIDYKVYNEEKRPRGQNHLEKFSLENLDTGLQEGIKGMRSGGRRIITIPQHLARQYVEEGEYAIYDVKILKIHGG